MIVSNPVSVSFKKRIYFIFQTINAYYISIAIDHLYKTADFYDLNSLVYIAVKKVCNGHCTVLNFMKFTICMTTISLFFNAKCKFMDEKAIS